MWALLSATYLSSLLHSETGNTILQLLYSTSVPLGRAALVSSIFSLSLLFFISFSPSFFPLFFLLSKTQLSACLSGATPQMKWHTVEQTERHSVAWSETEFPWRLLLGATQAIVARWWGASVRLHSMDFTQWLLYPTVIKWNHCFITCKWHTGLWLPLDFHRIVFSEKSNEEEWMTHPLCGLGKINHVQQLFLY